MTKIDWLHHEKTTTAEAIYALQAQEAKTQLSAEGTTSDLISRQAAIDILDAFEVKIENGEPFAYSWARMRITELHSAQPEIVRCKDCRYADEDGVCQNSKGLAIQDDYDFCSYAERRTDCNGRD